MQTITDIQVYLQTVTNKKITYTDIGNILGTGKANISLRAKNKSKVTEKEIQLLERAYNVDIKQKSPNLKINLTTRDIANNVTIPFYPDVVFSAGYGVEIYDDGAKEFITLDEKIFKTERGTKINPKYCELLTISGNSMSPKWEDGDRFILDKSVTTFIDGQTFAFKLNGECYIKEICLLGRRAKAIPLNKDYDEFYIEPEDELQIFGRVVPKVRL